MAREGAEDAGRGATRADSGEVASLRRERDEARARERAITDVLRAMAGRTADLQGVLDEIAASAARLCEIGSLLIARAEGDVCRAVASFPHGGGGASIVLTRATVMG